jgi:hypothetical protein
MKTLEEMETFSEVPRSCINGDSNQFLYFKTRFVLDYKEHEKRYKVRLVVMAYNWEEGYYSEFFLLLSKEWSIIGLDANNAFVNSNIPEEYTVYLNPPEGYGKDVKLWKLNKALYGLPLSGKLCYLTVRETLLDLGWKVSSFDSCFFITILRNL